MRAKALDFECARSVIILHMKTQDDRFTIREAAAELGLSDHTLRYYERIGLIHPIDRGANKHRRYTRDDIGWIEFLSKLRSTGMPIREMLAYTELTRQGDETLPQRLEILRTHQKRVAKRLAEYQEHMELINYKVAYYQNMCDEMEKLG